MRSRTLFTTLTYLALAGLKGCTASTNLNTEFASLSASCQKLLKSYATTSSTIGTCTGVGNLVVGLAANGKEDSGAKGTSVLPSVAGWLSDTCGGKGCTKSALKNGISQVESECSDDLDKKSYLPLLVKSLLENFDEVRKVSCEHQKSNKKEYCASVVLDSFEQASGHDFDLDFFSAVVVQPLAFINSLNGKDWCTVCLNDMVVKSEPVIHDMGQSYVKQTNQLLKDKCGAKFKPSQAQKGITEATGKAALKFDSAAMPQIPLADLGLLVPLLPILIALH